MANIERELAELKVELRRLADAAMGALPLLLSYREAARQLGLKSVSQFKVRYVRTKRILVVQSDGGRPMVPAEEVYRVVRELQKQASRSVDPGSTTRTKRRRSGSKANAEAEVAKLEAALRKKRRR